MKGYQKGLTILLLALFGILAAGCSGGNSPETTQPPADNSDALAVRDPWARPALAGDNGGAFFIVDNGKNEPVALLSASGDVAATIEVHLSTMEGDVMKMEKQEKVEVAPNSQLEFKPGSYHIMLINLNRELKVGDTFTLDLAFDNGESLPIIVTVKQP